MLDGRQMHKEGLQLQKPPKVIRRHGVASHPREVFETQHGVFTNGRCDGLTPDDIEAIIPVYDAVREAEDPLEIARVLRRTESLQKVRTNLIIVGANMFGTKDTSTHSIRSKRLWG